MSAKPLTLERYDDVEKSWEGVLEEMSDEHKEELERLLEESFVRN